MRALKLIITGLIIIAICSCSVKKTLQSPKRLPENQLIA